MSLCRKWQATSIQTIRCTRPIPVDGWRSWDPTKIGIRVDVAHDSHVFGSQTDPDVSSVGSREMCRPTLTDRVSGDARAGLKLPFLECLGSLWFIKRRY